jgi:hypothetical protein
MKNAAFWDMVLCGSCKNQRFGGTYCLLARRIGELGTLAVTSNYSMLRRHFYFLIIKSVSRECLWGLPVGVCHSVDQNRFMNVSEE